MKKIKTITILLVAGLAVIGVLGAAVYHTVSAQTDTPEETLTRDSEHPRMGGYASNLLAEALGITSDELEAARAEARTALIDQALEQGLITEAQADSLRAGGEKSPFGRGWENWLADSGLDYDALLAGALGITVDELTDAREQAELAAIDQAVENGRLSSDQAELIKARRALADNENFAAAMKDAYTQALQAAVDEGVITQAQADLLLENYDAKGGLFPMRPDGHGGRR
jgi:hypothetical protein